MDKLKSLVGMIPQSWKERLYGATGTGVAIYGGPQAKELAEVVFACLRAHYGF